MDISTAAIALVLAAAVLHAVWNAMVKGAADPLLTIGLVSLGHLLLALVALPFVPLPGWEAVPWLVASTIIHWGYYVLLALAYRIGDLSVVYPISRGSAPLMIAVSAQLFVGETLPLVAWAGIGTISLGIMLLALRSKTAQVAPMVVVTAVAVAICVASYSVVDGVGVRSAPTAMAYITWLFLLESFFALGAFWFRRDALHRVPLRTYAIGIVGGVISATAYGLALYAKTFAPIGVVSALRETSVIVAAMIGVVWFGERPLGRRLLAATVVALGIVIIVLA